MTSVDSQLSGGPSPESAGETHLALAVGHSPVIFYTASAHGDFPLTYISRNIESQTGHTAENMLSDGSYRDRYIHPDDLTSYRQACKNLRAGGTASCRYRLRLADGGERWYRDELSLPVDDGSVLTGCMIDISAEMVATETSRDLRKIYQDAVESIDGGFCVTDSDDRIIACNTMLAMSTGFGPERFIGHPRRRLVEDILKKIEIFDGEPVEQTTAWADKISKRISEPTSGGLELKLAAGYWVRATFAPTVEGGQIILITDIHAQKKLEREMRESAERFRLLVESHPLPVMLVDVKTGSILYESPAASALLGHEWGPEADFKVQDMYADPDERQRVVAELRRDGILRNRRIKQKRDDGSLYWISLTSNLIVYEGREVHIASIVDITEEQDRETALAQAHETLEDAIESLSEGFALFDPDDRLITFNSRFREFNAICAELIEPGTLFEDIIRTGMERGQYYGERAEIEEFLKGHMADREGGRARFGFEYRLANGDWFQYSSQPTRQGGIVVTLTDISKSREMQRALRESEASVRQILEGCPAPITVSRGDDSVILYESPASKKLFRRGGEGDNIVARDYWADKNDRDQIWRELQISGLVQDRTIQFRDGDGKNFWASYSARLVENQGEKMIVSAILDLTEYRALEEEMVRQREVLHVSEKMIAMGELLASVSHELNNPLSVVVGQALLLQETATDAAVIARAERIVSSADRCARIVKTFLSMARQQPRESSPISVNDLIDLALEVAGYSLRASNIEIVRNQAPALPNVLVDADQIVQVFTNLMVNAEQALREIDGPRRLTIVSLYRPRSKMVVVKIRDNGPGIPDDIRRRIFEPFFTTKEVGDGTGIGLALCHRILQSHGGKIKLESAPGHGATFVMRLPAQMDDYDTDEDTGQAASTAEQLSILIIDDEADVAELLSDILKLDGHDTAITSNGKEGLALLAQTDFDIVLSDLRMPEMDGPAVFEQLRAEQPQYLDRIGFLTGDMLSKDMGAFLSESGRPYIEKPITPSDVRALISRISADNGPDLG